MSGEEVKGDAMLQLLLFEADARLHGVQDGDQRYRGGSGGAYEKWCNLAAGSVIAILNPRVLRPLRVSGGHPARQMLMASSRAANHLIRSPSRWRSTRRRAIPSRSSGSLATWAAARRSRRTGIGVKHGSTCELCHPLCRSSTS
jgi:minichromosome maintenance protein 10